MDLALLVYGISIGVKLAAILGIVAALLLILSIGMFVYYMAESSPESYYSKTENEARVASGAVVLATLKKYTLAALICLGIVAFIPNEKTSYTMVAAYATQKIAEDPKVQQLSGKILQVVEAKLDSYIADSTKK